VSAKAFEFLGRLGCPELRGKHVRFELESVHGGAKIPDE